MLHVTYLLVEESRIAAAVVKVSDGVARIKVWVSTIDGKLGMLVEGGDRKYCEGLKGSNWTRLRTVRSVADLIDLITTPTGGSKVWSE